MFRRLFTYRLSRFVLVVGSCLALGGGVAAAYWWALPDARWFLLLIPFLFFSLRRHNVVTLLLLVTLCFGLGWWRGTVHAGKLAVYESLYGQKVTVVGHASEEAVYGNRYQLTFTMDQVQLQGPNAQPLPGQLMISGFGEPAIYRGDLVQVTGKMYPTRGNNQARMSFAQLEVVGERSTVVDDMRRDFAAGMQSALPEPQASFALGLLIGQRTTLPKEVSEQLLVAGLTHIIAVSGYNLTIIVQMVRSIFEKRSKFQTAAWSLLLIGTFLLFTGNSPSIVRASIISVLGLAVWYVGRNIKPVALLLVAAAITLLMNPGYLWGNVSWYLSFLAFFGVLVMAPLVTKRLFGEKKPKLVLQVVIESACAGIMTAPYILYIFGETSLVALLANVLVVPLIPLAMLFGLIAGLAGMLVPMIAGWLAWPATFVLTFILDIANLLSRAPHAFVEHIDFSLPSLLYVYGVVAAVLLVLRHVLGRTLTVTSGTKEENSL